MTRYNRTLYILLGFLAAFVLAGCSRKVEKTRAECVAQMEAVWQLAEICRDEKHLGPEHLFTPEELSAYCHPPLYHCPLGTSDYPPFTYAAGPKCPNAPSDHTGARAPEKTDLRRNR
jgi:hypothetical protein